MEIGRFFEKNSHFWIKKCFYPVKLMEKIVFLQRNFRDEIFATKFSRF